MVAPATEPVGCNRAAILGAGIFSVIAPAAGIAGPALLVPFSIAASIALCNALLSAQLASAFPRSGGTYAFGRQVLGPWWGYLAGWMFLVANTVGPGVIALAFHTQSRIGAAKLPIFKDLPRKLSVSG